MIIISLSIIIASINHSTHTRAIDYNMKNSPLLEYWESNNRITNNPKIFPIFQTSKPREGSHYRNHRGMRALSMRTPCMTVDDVGQRGNRSWGSVRVVDSWPSKRRSTLLCSYHAISCCPLESGPRASFLASFTLCKLYLETLSRGRAALFSYFRDFVFEKRIRDRSTFYRGSKNCIKSKFEKREISLQGRMYGDTLYVDTVGGERHNSDAPRKLQHGASVCCAKIPLDLKTDP